MNAGTITKLGKMSEKFVSDNAPTILTGIGVVGTVATAVLTGQASFKASKLIQEKKFIKHLQEPATTKLEKAQELTTFDKVKLTWTCYLPPVATATITITSIVMAQRINAKRMAALAAGYSLLNNRFSEYEDKIREKLGVKKESEAKDEIAQDRTDKNPPDTTIIVTEGKAMFRDEPSGRYFESTMEDINRAENELNRKIMKDEFAVLTDWYELLGLGPTSLSEDFGWDISTELMDMSKRAVILPNGKPCITLDYNVHPVRNGYSRDGGGKAAKIHSV